MASRGEHGETARKRTDASLAAERGRTDDELASRDADLLKRSAKALADARHRADDVVARARAGADERRRTSAGTPGDRASLEDERRREDATLREERATADEELALEREAHLRALLALASERKKTDEDLLLERAGVDVAICSRDDFLAMASHDLHNLLGGIALSATSLSGLPCDGPAGDTVVREAQRLQRQTARMSRLVDDLVDVVSIEAGRLALAPGRHDAAELLRETLALFQPLAAAKGIELGGDTKASSLPGRYDHDRVLQVLTNLVGNALKFTPNGGQVHLDVERVADELRFSVTDTGPGIAPDDLHPIFERFWQVPGSKTRSGLGLGLYISKAIVEAHGGRIWAESRPGQGSTFRFTLSAPEHG